MEKAEVLWKEKTRIHPGGQVISILKRTEGEGSFCHQLKVRQQGQGMKKKTSRGGKKGNGQRNFGLESRENDYSETSCKGFPIVFAEFVQIVYDKPRQKKKKKGGT